ACSLDSSTPVSVGSSSPDPLTQRGTLIKEMLGVCCRIASAALTHYQDGVCKVSEDKIRLHCIMCLEGERDRTVTHGDSAIQRQKERERQKRDAALVALLSMHKGVASVQSVSDPTSAAWCIVSSARGVASGAKSTSKRRAPSPIPNPRHKRGRERGRERGRVSQQEEFLHDLLASVPGVSGDVAEAVAKKHGSLVSLASALSEPKSSGVKKGGRETKRDSKGKSKKPTPVLKGPGTSAITALMMSEDRDAPL
ncbi:hypothetical protein KIPB_003873, partial [Kipferlia bialata]